MRKIKNKKKKLLPDLKYNSKLITYFINNIMKKGKKNIAYKIYYKVLNYINNKFKYKNLNFLKIFKYAIKNASPEVEIKRRKIGGSTYNIPIRISNKRKIFLSIKWLILNSKKRSEKKMYIKLANEIISTYKGYGNTIKKKNELQKLADSNKAFINFRY
ncbi:MAG: 30S ribosomal protein S7 [Candidatus Shikimatogenerans sp. JK-2022]|nr:30S ribosomal protein S7 [Candidatus Shikimatogenerans bostrichidophilus]